ncbi:small nuclear ribonucleoprotein Sm D3b-like protein, partial [Tanacetum coccineum]
DGKVSQLEHVFIRGSKVRFMIIPDMLKNAPMFKRLEARIKGKSSALGVGRGRAVAMRARLIPKLHWDGDGDGYGYRETATS